MSTNTAQPNDVAGQVFSLAFSLHARPAALLVKLAQRFESDIGIECDRKHVSAKSILGVLTLCADKGMRITITATGDDAVQAIKAISKLLATLEEEAHAHSSCQTIAPRAFYAQAG